MLPFFHTVHGFSAGREEIRARRYGVIDMQGGELRAIHLRCWPKLFSLAELWPAVAKYHARGSADRCLLYYNQPRRQSNFLALKFIVSTAGTTYRTFRGSLAVLDAVAALKRTDAIVCDVANTRISDRLLARLGWEPLNHQRWHRNYIRRFYGKYPVAAETFAVGAESSQRCCQPSFGKVSDLVLTGSDRYLSAVPGSDCTRTDAARNQGCDF